jgi:ribosomal-protein-alanine N-acetyltransferase
MKSPCPAPVSFETAPDPAHRSGAALIQLGAEHLEVCLALDQLALGGLWNRDQWRAELLDPRRPCLGLLLEQRLLGLACGWLVVDELHITAVAVDPAQRRQGLGRTLVDALLHEARQQGAHHATLEVSSANSAAMALYGACGFRCAGVRRGYYRNGDDALIQWVRLQEAKEVRIAAHS